jgi:hypothetical protein
MRWPARVGERRQAFLATSRSTGRPTYISARSKRHAGRYLCSRRRPQQSGQLAGWPPAARAARPLPASPGPKVRGRQPLLRPYRTTPSLALVWPNSSLTQKNKGGDPCSAPGWTLPRTPCIADRSGARNRSGTCADQPMTPMDLPRVCSFSRPSSPDNFEPVIDRQWNRQRSLEFRQCVAVPTTRLARPAT